MKNQDYRIRNITLTPSMKNNMNQYTGLILTKINKHEAAYIDNYMIVPVDEKLCANSIITVKQPRKEKIDYSQRLSSEKQRRVLSTLKEELNLKQKQLDKITRQINNEFKTLQKEVESLQQNIEEYDCEINRLIEEVTIKVVNEDKQNKWRKDFNKHYEGIINCLSNVDKGVLPADIKEELKNKRNILLTYFDEF